MITQDHDFMPGEISTADYKPQWIYGPYFWESRKPWFHRRFIPAMLRDSRVSFGLRLLKGPIISSAKFEIKADSEEVGEFVEDNLDRFWRTSASVALRAFEWGYSGSESIYKIDEEGRVTFHCLKPLGPFDCRIWTIDGVQEAIRVRDPLDSDAGFVWLHGPKGFWHLHRKEEHRWYGISRLLTAFPAWYDKYKNGGARDSVSLFFYKYAAYGDAIWYPPNIRRLPNGEVVDPEKTAERLATQMRMGATLTLPNEKDENGNKLWEIERAQNTASGAELMDYFNMLDGQIFEGLGIPSELVEAGQTSSGYAGRRVPAQSFYAMLQELGENLLTDWEAQIGRPLVQENYPGETFKVKLEPLSASELEEDPDQTLEEGEVPGAEGAPAAPQENPYQ